MRLVSPNMSITYSSASFVVASSILMPHSLITMQVNERYIGIETMNSFKGNTKFQ